MEIIILSKNELSNESDKCENCKYEYPSHPFFTCKIIELNDEHFWKCSKCGFEPKYHKFYFVFYCKIPINIHPYDPPGYRLGGFFLNKKYLENMINESDIDYIFKIKFPNKKYLDIEINE